MQQTTLGFPNDDWRKLRKILLVAGALVATGVIPNKYGKTIAVASAIVAVIAG